MARYGVYVWWLDVQLGADLRLQFRHRAPSGHETAETKGRRSCKTKGANGGPFEAGGWQLLPPWFAWTLSRVGRVGGGLLLGLSS